MRVLTRLFALPGDPRRAPLAGQLWELARALIVPGAARDFNQALMELGATVCIPRAPRCDVCPLSGRCKARALERVEDFPERGARPRWTEEVRAVAVLRRRGRVLVVKAPADAARWAGMWQFPDLLLAPGASAEKALVDSLRSRFGLNVELAEQIGRLQHQVTRFRIQLVVYAGKVLSGRGRAEPAGGLTWSLPEDLSERAMPVAHREIARSLLAEDPSAALHASPRRRRGSATEN
jgi:A/G-specific adenine glycosylase